MIRHYFLMALRHFQRRPGYAALNLSGLTLGIAATLFLLLYLTDELRYDRHNVQASRIFRVSSDITEPDAAFRWANTQMPLGPTLQQEYPAVESFVRFFSNDRTRLEYQDRNFFSEKVFFVDSTVFDIFTFDLIKGKASTALDRPNCIVLSETLARRIFGAADPVGKYLEHDDGEPYEVTGVYRDMPRQSHLRAETLISGSTAPYFRATDTWGGFGVYTYVLLRPDADPRAFEAGLQRVIDKYVATIFDEVNIKVRYLLIPLKDIHLKSDFQGEPEPVGRMAFIYIFGAVALFLLLIAAINYMNLATAQATQRAMEVGMRKVLGASRENLMGFFLAESFLLTFTALFVAFASVAILIPAFNGVFGLQLDRSLLWSGPVLLGAVVILLLLGIFSGSYPALYLSGFRPIAVLKGRLAGSGGNQRLREGLVIVQFALTLFVLIGTGIIYDQMNFVRHKDLGFDREQVLTFQMASPEARRKWPVVREKLRQNPAFTAMGTASSTPGQGFGRLICGIESAGGEMETLGLALYQVDYDFFPTLGVRMAAGRNFSREYTTDSTSAVMVNEAMVKRMNWDNPIGKQIRLGGGDSTQVHRVIGVVSDFNQEALYNPIEPLLFVFGENNPIAHIRVRGDMAAAVHQLEEIWQETYPAQPFEYTFVDDSLQDLYTADRIRSRIFTFFAVLMIAISCIGLFGLASFATQQRTKEIGIRKIAGATIGNIMLLLTHRYILLIGIAAIPACFASWYFMSRWLNTFTYHAGMNFWLFPMAILLTTCIALTAIGWRILQAARKNPVEALRYE